MDDLIKVRIQLLGEEWQMPLPLKESLYEHIFENPYQCTSKSYLDWFNSLSKDEQDQIIRTTFH